ncbi:S46 family peptidase [Falsiporphyromonas endometrii]|uniref:Dipeptidyl-peptidase n=1 Tax=Falsiporphyromonas endometrii TaxID=1387297 RepID=A0ABV9K5E8_9PORP
MKKFFLMPVMLCLAIFTASADGGMWLMQQMQAKYQAMKAKGLELNALDLYNPDGSSIKDAVIMFDGGCTGAIVSNQGLILTNHHCGYDQIQAHSSLEHNYLKDGFWAMTQKDELACPGLEVITIDQITDVTKQVKKELKKIKDPNSMDYLSPKYLTSLVPKIVGKKAMKEQGVRYLIKAFYGGNQYLMFKQLVYTDVRFVGAPPSTIGKYGEDTDNWAWPRHSGDFSVFRIYTDKNGKPADYSADNIPLKPKKWFKVSTKGLNEGDYAMIMGFPGHTYHFFTPAEVEEWGTIDNNIRIQMRGIRQEIMLRSMLADPQTKIMYAAKYASSQNGYKRAQGANWAITKRNLKAFKEKQMDELLDWAKKQGDNRYANAVEEIAKIVGERKGLRTRLKYLDETMFYGIEITGCRLPVSEVVSLLKKNKGEEARSEIRKAFDHFYNKDYSPVLDEEIAKAMLAEYCKEIPSKDWPSALNLINSKFGGNIDNYVSYVYGNSIFVNKTRFEEAMKLSNSALAEKLEKDPVLQFSQSMINEYISIQNQLAPFDAPLSRAQEVYIAGMMKMLPEDQIWPDANLTLRFTFGQMKGYSPKDDVYYGPQTTLTGVMEKEDPNNWEYNVAPKLKQLFEAKDYGQYAMANGKMPVDICCTTHTTGGNSGSPVMNSKGELVGLNFDRNWEGVGGDIEYLPEYQRSIILDIRYLLFIIDKYGGCHRLIEEMGL